MLHWPLWFPGVYWSWTKVQMAAVVLCCFLVLVWLGVSWSCINIFRRRPRPLFQEVFASPKLTSEVRRAPLWFSFGWSTFFTRQWEIKALPKIQCEGVAASSVCQWLACVKRITWSVLGVQWSLNLCGTGSLSVEIYLNCIWKSHLCLLCMMLWKIYAKGWRCYTVLLHTSYLLNQKSACHTVPLMKLLPRVINVFLELCIHRFSLFMVFRSYWFKTKFRMLVDNCPQHRPHSRQVQSSRLE